MPSHVKTDSGKRLTRLMTKCYLDHHKRAREGAFVVWIAIIVPAEIFLGFENVVYCVPESHSAMTAAKGLGPGQCEKAETQGYSMDLCSYARIDIGTAFDEGKNPPVGGLPKPDLLISNNNNCSLLVKWFDVYHRQWQVPHFMLDIPFCYEEQKIADKDYILNQFGDLIKTIEKMSGQKFDLAKVDKAVKHSSEALKHWRRFLKCAEHRPSGITAFDSFVQMAPILTMRGTPEYEDHFRFLANETEERMANGIFPVPDEKYRLFWDNIAPWHQLRKMQKRLAELQANITTASYTSCIGVLEGETNFYPYDGQDPLDYLARTQNNTICPHGMHLRRKFMLEMMDKAGVDGVIFASNRSCKPYSVMQLNQQQYISSVRDMPTVMVDVDHADIRTYNEQNVMVRIEALLENIEARRSQ